MSNIGNELLKPLDAANVKSRNQGGRDVSYVEGWHAIAEANRIFGWNGWTRETLTMKECRAPENIDNKWRVGFVSTVRVTVGETFRGGDGYGSGIATVGKTFRDGTGYGSGIAKDLGDAYESAVKEAETDAMKRALMTFGNPFGLALYDKTQANVVRVDPFTAFMAKLESAESLDELGLAWSNGRHMQSQPGAVEAKDKRKAELSLKA